MSTETFPIFNLPEELVLAIADKMDDKDLSIFQQTSKVSNRVGQISLYKRLSHDEIRRLFKWASWKSRLPTMLQVIQHNRAFLAKNPDLASEALYFACHGAYDSVITALLDAGVPPQTKAREYVPLELAAMHGHLDIMNILLAAGAKLEATSFADRYTILCTGKPNRLPVAKQLVQLGFDVTQLDKEGNSFLHEACRTISGFSRTRFDCDLLLELGLDINARNARGETPLIQAMSSRDGDGSMVRFLLSRGADVNIATPRGWCPLKFSVLDGKTDSLETVLKAGARMDETLGLSIIARTLAMDWVHGLTLLLRAWKAQMATVSCAQPEILFCAAARVGDFDLLRELLQKGEVDPDGAPARTTAITAAAARDTPDVLEFLMPHVSCYDFVDFRGHTALEIAIDGGSDEMVRLLLPHTSSVAGLLVDAVRKLKANTVKMILDRITDDGSTHTGPIMPWERLVVDPVTHEKRRPTFTEDTASVALAAAVDLRKLETVQLLLGRPNCVPRPCLHNDLLHRALLDNNDNEHIALALIDWDTSLVDPEPVQRRSSPLLLAARNGNTKAVSAMLAKGTDPNTKDESEATALTLAVYHNHPDLVRVLLAAGAKTSDPIHIVDPAELSDYKWATLTRPCQRPAESLFIHAASHGYLEIFKLLMPHFEADITKPLPVELRNRANALQLAAAGGHLDVVTALLETKKFDLHYKDLKGKTARDYANRSGRPLPKEILQQLSVSLPVLKSNRT
ncbi:uncharacterized protein DSM5745_05169 [Aspergillus mulundensis]|uniref:F-box domain-containing protein n=1 Tax=Aspergillus mulundensis TaxID=1810919 RepID=A0A3D8S5N8_9EURO|nr:hypothetical protein DSM5745_05169 [Aspergillus mulundensis]RDW81612.1 hypothetical protein DSM5745_05169 [Aspergillus mulundensis]